MRKFKAKVEKIADGNLVLTLYRAGLVTDAFVITSIEIEDGIEISKKVVTKNIIKKENKKNEV
jgi:hypothetical protein